MIIDLWLRTTNNNLIVIASIYIRKTHCNFSHLKKTKKGIQFEVLCYLFLFIIYICTRPWHGREPSSTRSSFLRKNILEPCVICLVIHRLWLLENHDFQHFIGLNDLEIKAHKINTGATKQIYFKLYTYILNKYK